MSTLKLSYCLSLVVATLMTAATCVVLLVFDVVCFVLPVFFVRGAAGCRRPASPGRRRSLEQKALMQVVIATLTKGSVDKGENDERTGRLRFTVREHRTHRPGHPIHCAHLERCGPSTWMRRILQSSRAWLCSSWGVRHRDGDRPRLYSLFLKKSLPHVLAAWRSLASIPASGCPAG